jgi:hypothetical protein
MSVHHSHVWDRRPDIWICNLCWCGLHDSGAAEPCSGASADRPSDTEPAAVVDWFAITRGVVGG